MTQLNGRAIFEKGDELFVRFPEKPDETVKVVAVPMIKDSDVCYGCIFHSTCRKYPGNSPFAWLSLLVLLILGGIFIFTVSWISRYDRFEC